ncbi:MAG: alpha/beta fold hydrolase [Bacteroidota bacterium]|nr:alpha/beta fold hydrolase [Bacteroidota bacterium]
MKATINNSLMHYIDIGISTAMPVILIHGFPFNHKMWMMPGGQTESLAGMYHVIAYDVRGHGESEVGDGMYSIEFFADDLLGLMDHLNVQQAVVLGLSMGGYIALRAIQKKPERFKGLVLCNTRADADSNESKIKRAAAIRAIKTNGPRIFAQEMVKNLFAPLSFETKQNAVKLIESTIERTAPLALCGTELALAARVDSAPSLPAIKVPTLIMTGELDAIAPPETGKAMQEAIPNSDFFVIPQAAHLSNLENPDEFNRHVLEFLQKAG